MKIYHDSKFKYFLIVLFAVNILYLKLAKNESKEVAKQIEISKINPEAKPIELISIESTSELKKHEKHEKHVRHVKHEKGIIYIIYIDESEHQPVTESNNAKNSTITNSTQDIVTDIGQNIGEGLKPMPIDNNLASFVVKTEETDIPISNPTQTESSKEIQNYDRPILYNILTFVTITMIVLLVFVSYIAYQNYQRNKMFDVDIETLEGYKLITDQ